MLAGQPFYSHLGQCPVIRQRDAEFDQERRRLLGAQLRLQRSNLPEDIEDIGDLAGYIERFGLGMETRDGITLCQGFLAAARREPFPLDGFTLHGTPGGGKSTLILAFARSLMASGIDVRFEVVPQLYTHFLNVNKNGDLEGELGRYGRFKVLVLDDLGREKPSPWWVDQILFPLINDRYANGRPTIITSNYTWNGLEAIYGAARSERGEVAHSAPQLIDRLQHRSAAVQFGRESNRQGGWGFLKGAA